MLFRVSPAEAGQRLDVWLTTQHPGVTRSQIRHWLDAGRVTLNGAVVRAGTGLRVGDEVTWEPPEIRDESAGPAAEELPLDVIHQDADIVVVNKAPGMVVHPGAGVRTGTLVSALKGRGISLAALGGPSRPGIVHRLDRGTSGLLVVARTDAAYAALVAAIAARDVHRGYRALVWGVVQEDEGQLTGDIARSRADRRRMTVVPKGGRPALTRFRVRARHALVTDLDLELETGRTHQIRVHWRHRGQPVFGDPEYGGRARANLSGPDQAIARFWLARIARQALHACRLEFHHPITRAPLSFEAPLPPDMAALYAAVAAGGSADAHGAYPFEGAEPFEDDGPFEGDTDGPGPASLDPEESR